MFLQQGGCSHDKAYIAVLIAVLPLWSVITTLIVLVLITFHKHLRATKIYDNCTKLSANYIYHVELRTGDTSATYNRRKTTITIDMFDENQTTLARVAVPGHVIFGRKDAPIQTVDDERFFELRVTRLWLYRISKLKRVATIRITHTCLENEARIMIYGVEIRSSESDQPKVFFPVMNYVTAYGTVNKPNACFDSEPLGSISGMGGQVEQSIISDQLSFVDYTLLVLLLCSLLFHFATYNVLEDSMKNSTQAAYKGAILGCCCFSVTLIVGIAMRYVIRHNYSQRIGTGLWGAAYYVYCVAIFLPATCLWIYTAYDAFKNLCTSDYSMWLLSICVGVVESVALAFVCTAATWFLQSCSPVYAEQYVMPEDVSLVPNEAASSSASRQRAGHPHSRSSRQQHHLSVQAPSWQAAPPVPVQYIVGPPGGYPTPPGYGQPQGYNMITSAQQAGFKTYQPQAGYPYDQQPQQQQAPSPMPFYNLSPSPATITQQSPGPSHHSPHHQTTIHQTSPPGSPLNYHQQTAAKATKKVSSNESTGSTYYQQLMKNKGGVKSISQYGELIKQKKTTTTTAAPATTTKK